MKGLRRYLVLPGIWVWLNVIGCPDLLTSRLEEPTQQTGTDDSGQPSLRSGDYPDVNPCRDRDTLPDDTTFLDVITAATQIVHIHDEYLDDDNLAAVCGLSSLDNGLDGDETGWDPSEGRDVYICYKFGENLSDYLISDMNHPEICRSNFGFETEGSFDGLPRGGIYRIDACVEGEGGSYRVRVRVEVSGDDINKTLVQLGLKDLESLQFYDEGGTEMTTTEQAKELVTTQPDGFTFTVRSEKGVRTHLTVKVRVVCVKKQVSACPKPTEACDE